MFSYNWGMVPGARRRVQGAGSRVPGARCQVQGAGCRVQGDKDNLVATVLTEVGYYWETGRPALLSSISKPGFPDTDKGIFQ